MKLSKQQTKDVANIMGVPERLVKILPYVDLLDKPPTLLLKKILNEAFSQINFNSEMKILDLACGQGSISIPLAEKYKLQVDGYDILPGFIEYASEKAEEKQVSHLCKFRVADARDVVKRAKNYDVVLWFSPPHLWKTPKATIKQLRRCCRNGEYIIINDAYLYPGVIGKKDYKTYETKQKTTKEFVSFGDSIVKILDYNGKNWKKDYEGDRKRIKKVISETKIKRDKEFLREYIESLNKSEEKDTKNLGCAVWVIKIKKPCVA